MKFLKVIGIASFVSFGLSACGDSLKTQKELSEFSYEEFANTICNAITDANLEQLKSNVDDKFFKRMQKISNKDEFSDFVDNIDCSEVTLTEKSKGSKKFTLATFGGKAKFRFAIIKKDGFYSVVS
mgnify:CR=1 FL=1|jgi:hypothetical protein|tara:strand:- start:6799 stop:7176 length:378 start_codon:yes stop_codon:yes gene_type:complete